MTDRMNANQVAHILYEMHTELHSIPDDIEGVEDNKAIQDALTDVELAINAAYKLLVRRPRAGAEKVAKMTTKTAQLEAKACLRIGDSLETQSGHMICTGLTKQGSHIKVRAIPFGEYSQEQIAEWRNANEDALNGKFAFQPGRFVGVRETK